MPRQVFADRKRRRITREGNAVMRRISGLAMQRLRVVNATADTLSGQTRLDLGALVSIVQTDGVKPPGINRARRAGVNTNPPT